ncbi:hypothetical protein [Amphibacillus sp. MSJ-3]|nr:hypothetical protein [Amphibacillus sp. MSJ-3]
MKKMLIFISFVLILVSLPIFNEEVRVDNDIRRPFIPGREQNLF